MKKTSAYRVALSVVIAVFVYGCNPVKWVPEGSYLLRRNVIQVDTLPELKESLSGLIKQKPNRRLLGVFYPYVWFYQKGSTGKTNGFKRWLKEIGEEPSILDTALTHRTANQLRLYMWKHGFFNATVTDTFKTEGRFATSEYIVKSGTPYTIGRIEYSTRDSMLNPLIQTIRSATTLQSGHLYDEEAFEKERERIASALKDLGFYSFSKNFVTFKVDSGSSPYKTDLYVYLNRLNENLIQTSKQPPAFHHPYRFRDIYIQADFDPKDPASSTPVDTTEFREYGFLTTDGKTDVRNRTLADCIFFRQGDLFSQHQVNYSYQRLQNLSLFKYININFTEVPRDSSQTEYLLDAKLLMSPMARQDFTVEADATNTGGNLGLSGSVGYRNKNLFQGAETFEFKIRGGVQSLPNFTDSTIQKKLFFFNTYQFGPEVTLQFKEFLIPGARKMFPENRRLNPRTIITAGYDLQDRPDYRRSILKMAMGYTWRKNAKKSFALTPIDINSVYVDKSASFQAQLDSLKDPKLQYSYDTHLITSLHFTYVYSNQKDAYSSFFFARSNFETAGLLMNAAAKTFGFSKGPDGLYRFVGIPYSQYIKPEFDLSYHHAIDRNNTMVYRINAGLGLPYANSKALPFEKSFFAGGANSMRAWVAYTLGPGAYINRQGIEQSGDIKLECNLEYRTFLLKFMGTSSIESALFTDIGNIWTLNVDPNRPGAEFKASEFYRQLGIGSGLGLRFNFSFFILRLDMAMKLLDPGLETESKWVYPQQKFVISDVTPNLAIGYPF